MTNTETELFYHSYDPSYSVPNPASRKKNGKLFVNEFFRFSLAVIAIENDDECRKQILSHIRGGFKKFEEKCCQICNCLRKFTFSVHFVN